MQKATITVVIDNPNSWFVPYGKELVTKFLERGHDATLVHTLDEIPKGDIAFFLSCEHIVSPAVRSKNTYNLVIHGSELPKGKGWSPLTWQILEGKHSIPITMFEAADAVDSGDVYGRASVTFEGHELIDELRAGEAEGIMRLALSFVDAYPHNAATQQSGEESFYERRTPKDSELDPEKTIAEQFNLLRVVDNERYPAYFVHQGHTYIVKIYKQ